MEVTLSKEIKVGLFAGLGLIAFLTSIILLGGDRVFFKSSYGLRVQFEDVQGLSRGSVVSLEGVPVGNVRSMQFIPKSKKIEVAMDIDSEFRHRITAGSIASVKTQGALGDKYIYIQSGALDAQPLADNALVETSEEGDLLDMITKKGAEFGQVLDAFKEVKELLRQMNSENRMGRLMQNMVADSAEIKNVLNDVKKPVAKLDSILTKIDRGDGTLGALINDPTLHHKLVQLFGGNTRNKFLTPMIRESIKESEH